MRRTLLSLRSRILDSVIYALLERGEVSASEFLRELLCVLKEMKCLKL